MILAENAVIDIKKAEYIDGYKLRLVFSNNKERIVDFGTFLHNALNPMIRKYLKLDNFKNFTVAYGDLFWNDYLDNVTFQARNSKFGGASGVPPRSHPQISELSANVTLSNYDLCFPIVELYEGRI